jgi:hypothetical protein
MEKLADAIVGGRVSCQRKIYGVIAATSQTAIEHRPVEAFIIGAAAEKYRSKSDLLFRTLIICKERIPPLGFSPPPILIATVPSIKSRFGKPKQWLLKLHMNMSRKPNAASAVQGEDGISQE